MKRRFTKYPSNYIKASEDNKYPYYIDEGAGLTEYGDILSLNELGNIYDTLVSDEDPIASQYDSFDSWLQDTVNSGLLSGCWMSDVQRSDMPYEFGGYEPEYSNEDEDEDEDY